ncbi:MAG: hypothetical protein JWO17_271 [Actinomycetia bacterium]|nr:hypothetical protein [Actinomycetes bacterium]
MVVTLAKQAGINVPKDEETADEPNLDIHALRHVFASAMIRATHGDAEKVRRLTGHANSQVLLEIYSHEFEGVRGGTSIAEQAALIDAAFGGGV